MKATHLLNDGAVSKDYQPEFQLQEYVDIFRKIIQIAVEQFKTYQAYNPRLHHIPSKLPHNIDDDDECNPLLSFSNNNPFSNNYQSQGLISNELELESNEEKMAYITEELTEMKDMFVDLDEIISNEQETVDLIENSVQESRDRVVSGSQYLIKAENNMKKVRCNRCICLITMIVIISSFLLYLWMTTSHRKP